MIDCKRFAKSTLPWTTSELIKHYHDSQFNGDSISSVLHDVILSMLAHDWYVEFMRPTQIPSRESYCEKLSNALMQDVVSNVFMTHVPLMPLRSFEQFARALFE